MPRIPPLDRDGAPAEPQPFFDRHVEIFRQVLNSTRIAAYRPAIAAAAKHLGQAVAEGGLIPTQLRLLMNVRVASLVGCPF